MIITPPPPPIHPNTVNQRSLKVFASGCFDMLHSGHVAFFEEAASYGDLYVGIGSDKTVFKLKGRKPFNTEDERLYMVKALKWVKDAWINKESGFIDFLPALKELRPDIFFVNSDGHSELKEQLCKDLGIKYIVGSRIPHGNLPARSTTALRRECRIPYRIDIAGGWLDQPEVSSMYPGPVLTISIEPDYEFNDRSGMATSSRKKAIDLWQIDIPAGDKVKLAKTLFCYENPPGTRYISGSQDALGIIMPGLNRLFYRGDYWPCEIKNVMDESILTWLENRLWLVPLYPRRDSYNVLENRKITGDEVKKLSDAAVRCWDAILETNIIKMGEAIRDSYQAQIAMYPNMVSKDIIETIGKYKNAATGWKLSGAGGGGYIILTSEAPIEKAIRIRIRREEIS